MKKTEHNIQTGEIKEVDMTPEEISQHELDRIAEEVVIASYEEAKALEEEIKIAEEAAKQQAFNDAVAAAVAAVLVAQQTP
jgi:hypothetical protein